MIDSEVDPGEEEGPAPRTDLLALFFLALTSFGLGLSASLGTLDGLAIPSGGLGLALFLRRTGRRVLIELSALPVLLVLGFLVMVAPASPGTDLLGGACGLAFLLWFATEGGARARLAETAGALAFPALALGVAVASSLLFPVSHDLLGLAAVIIAAELLFAAWLYSHPSDLSDAGSALSRASET